MADRFLGQSMSEAFKFISGGAAYTFTFGFQPDKVVFNNLTKWAATAGNDPISIWYRDQTTAAHAYQMQVIDSAAPESFNFLDASANGFTVADTAGGVAVQRVDISAVSKADPCVVTTSSAHGFQSGQLVRITDLGSDMPTNRGMDELNNNRYRITVLSTTTFSLQDPISDEDIDSSAFTTYVSGGSVTLITNVLALNNPQVSPYSEDNPYNQNPFAYDPVEYKLTAGTAVMGSDGDEYLIEVYKWGRLVNLGDLG